MKRFHYRIKQISDNVMASPKKIYKKSTACINAKRKHQRMQPNRIILIQIQFWVFLALGPTEEITDELNLSRLKIIIQ